MLDEVTEENGCLMVVPGTHKGPIHSLFKDGVFTGKMADEVESDMLARQIPVTGKVGSVCLMHTRLAHGSAANRSDRPRGLYICVYSAASLSGNATSMISLSRDRKSTRLNSSH